MQTACGKGLVQTKQLWQTMSQSLILFLSLLHAPQRDANSLFLNNQENLYVISQETRYLYRGFYIQAPATHSRCPHWALSSSC